MGSANMKLMNILLKIDALPYCPMTLRLSGLRHRPDKAKPPSGIGLRKESVQR
ncbi:hypothetical protein HMPREF0208_01401 [Citrobacter koseri]|nr:hypothetical protein HMPREF3220_00715 [Citrobacter koseri]KXB45369.1 hypothetical protein HMPREF0208_01401 [Citrobacter koseri]